MSTAVRTFTPSEAMNLTLPALPGLLADWSGPIDAAWCTGANTSHPRIVDWKESVVSPKAAYDPKYVRLALCHWECRARVARWLSEGELCPHCVEGQVENPVACYTGDAPVESCSRCKGTGYLRAPVDAWHYLDGPGKVEPWVSAALLHASALRAVAGLPAIPGTLNVWRMVTKSDPDTGETWIRGPGLDPMNRGGGLWACEKVQAWREFGWESGVVHDPATGMWLRGPETGELGKVKADEAALAAGYCLLDGYTLRVELPHAK